jgi:hypothetical protein
VGWARLDDSFADNPKIVALMDEEDGLAAIGLWTVCLTWAHRNTRGGRGKVPGLIPAGLLRRYCGAAGRQLADLLVLYGLWEMTDNGGWIIHDFDKYLSPDELARVTDRVTDFVTDRVTDVCVVCNSELSSTDRRARYCSSRCRQAAYRRNHVFAAQPTSDPDSVTENVTEVRNALRNALRNGDGLPSLPEPEPEPVTDLSPPETDLKDLDSMPEKRRQTVVDDPGFAEFWAAYPRRTAKGHARKAWTTAITKAEPETIIKAARQYRDNPRRPQDPKFVPHPATWLNGERWTDEDLVVPPPSSHSPWSS